jgi:AcrR family transcriptional regulator
VKVKEMRESLLVSATNLIDEGVNWTWSLRDIADDAGVASNEIFRRFGSRERFVESLCGRWHAELEACLAHHEGVGRHLENLRWIVSRRKRIIFLLAESLQVQGPTAVPRDISKFLPNLECVVKLLRELDASDDAESLTEEELATRFAEATQAGMGLLLFAPSPYVMEKDEEEELLRTIWQKLWQIATGREGASAPAYF